MSTVDCKLSARLHGRMIEAGINIRRGKTGREADFDLLVRMEDRFLAMDFFVIPTADLSIRFPPWITQQIPTELNRFWCGSPQQLLARLQAISEWSSAAL